MLIGAVAPWNNQTVYPGNTGGDWIKYFQDILLQCGANGCDGITLHTYTHGANPTLILDNSKLPDFPHYHCHFQAYRDFMQAIPVNMRHLPVYITETDQGGAWETQIEAGSRQPTPRSTVGIVRTRSRFRHWCFTAGRSWTAGISRGKKASLRTFATRCGTITAGRRKRNNLNLYPRRLASLSLSPSAPRLNCTMPMSPKT